MKQYLFIFVALSVLLMIRPVWACRMMVDDEHARKTAESAYFIGLVRTGYIHQWPIGYLKEAGLIPVLAYKSDPAVKFDEMIIVHNSKPSSCDAPLPMPRELLEVLIVKTEGELKMLRLGNLQTDKKDLLIDELRDQARYVGQDYNISWPKRKKNTENQ